MMVWYFMCLVCWNFAIKYTQTPKTMTPEIHCNARAAKRKTRRAVKAKVGTLFGAIQRGKEQIVKT